MVTISWPAPGSGLGPDLALTKTASAETVHPGGQVTYQLVVRNHGPGVAVGVTVEDPSPLGLSFENVESSQGHCTITTELHCELGSVHENGEVLIQLTATVTAAASGTIVNLATVRDIRRDPNELNNTATSTVHVTPGAQPVSDLVLTKHVDRPVARVGEQVRYTITVTNKGPDAATNVTLTDALALPVRVVSIHPGQGHCQTGPPITCTLGTLAAGAHTTITIVAVLTVAGEETNTAGVMSQERDPKPASNVAAAKTRILARAPRPARPRAPSRPPRVTG
jgi:uncharacterized repeat protein (TIGR01451 family)